MLQGAASPRGDELFIHRRGHDAPPSLLSRTPGHAGRGVCATSRWLLCRGGAGPHQKSDGEVSGLSGKSEVRCGLGRGGRCCPVRSLSGLVRDGRRLMPGWRRPMGSSAREECASRALRPSGQIRVRGFNVSGTHPCVSPEPVRSLTQRPATSTGLPGSGAPRRRRRSPGASCGH
jgi:hypothetical protein